ncbi:unnamed protein product [Polarella glacialis]|uniref:Uncharacterized protein n=1 Tax=Polarella glacialis TaxID=89957 RepID=A0A813IQ21_POLGL|nr:unnamed protein product [Polarella glacialis]
MSHGCLHVGPRGGRCHALGIYGRRCEAHQIVDVPSYAAALALNFSIRQGNLDMVLASSLVDFAGATSHWPASEDSKDAPLVLATSLGLSDIVRVLLEHRVMAGIDEALLVAVEFPETVLPLICAQGNDYQAQTAHKALCVAVSRRQSVAILELLRFSAPIEWTEHRAAMSGNLRIRTSALFQAAAALDESIVQQLLKAGASIQDHFSWQDLEDTPLESAFDLRIKLQSHTYRMTPAQIAAAVGCGCGNSEIQNRGDLALRIVKLLINAEEAIPNREVLRADDDGYLEPCRALLAGGQSAYRHAVKAWRYFYHYLPEVRRDALEVFHRRRAVRCSDSHGFVVHFTVFEERRVCKPHTANCTSCNSNKGFSYVGDKYFVNICEYRAEKTCLGCIGRVLADEVGVYAPAIAAELANLRAKQGPLLAKTANRFGARYHEVKLVALHGRIAWVLPYVRGGDRVEIPWTRKRIREELQDMQEPLAGPTYVSTLQDRILAKCRANCGNSISADVWTEHEAKLRRITWGEIKRIFDI